jgi:hypothetical protein
VKQDKEARQAAAKRANALVRACYDRLCLEGFFVVRYNNQPIAHRVAGQLVGYRKLHGSPRGMPDLFAVMPGGRVLFVECKSGKGVVGPEQRDVMFRLTRLGALVLVAREIGQFDLELKAALGQNGRSPRLAAVADVGPIPGR